MGGTGPRSRQTGFPNQHPPSRAAGSPQNTAVQGPQEAPLTGAFVGTRSPRGDLGEPLSCMITPQSCGGASVRIGFSEKPVSHSESQ